MSTIQHQPLRAALLVAVALFFSVAAGCAEGFRPHEAKSVINDSITQSPAPVIESTTAQFPSGAQQPNQVSNPPNAPAIAANAGFNDPRSIAAEANRRDWEFNSARSTSVGESTLLEGTTFDPTSQSYLSPVYDPAFVTASGIVTNANGDDANAWSFANQSELSDRQSSNNDVGDVPSLSADPQARDPVAHPLLHDLLSDQKNFYSCPNLCWVAAGIGGAAVFANTNVDQWFRQTYFEHLRPVDSNLDFVKDFGTGGLVIPAMVGLWVFDEGIKWVAGDVKLPGVEWVGEWSQRSLRGWLVGAVPLVTLQYVTGADRPGQSSAGSHWTPFKSTHGVSGHAFVGAVPFFTAADMTDFVPLKVGFYALGSAAGISRIYTDSHYLSQVALGWWLAYFSTVAVNETVTGQHNWQIMPLLSDNATGVAITYQY